MWLVFIIIFIVLFSVEGTFTKVGSNPGSTMIQVNNIGSDRFDPKKLSNWQYDIRFPLIPPQNKGTCPQNIYNANCVNNGGAWNIYFGGWDGVSSCHDSVSVVVTEDQFLTFGSHVGMIATGSVIHVNNPSAIKVNETMWLMVTTQLQNNPQLNKPAISRATNGIDWNPNQGGVPTADIQVSGYPGWDVADVNGGNVIFFEQSSYLYHFYFIDFKTESQHSVYHAISNGVDYHNFHYIGVALEEPMKVVNDLKLINGYYLMGLHFNGPEVWYSVSKSLNSTFPPSSLLFKHYENADQYIVSVGFVVDSTSQRLMGALYGAGPVPALDENKVFGIWLQKRVLFMNDNTVWGLGDASRAYGPNNVMLATNAKQLQGKFYLYDLDFVDVNNRGTLLEVSPTVIVSQGDIWQYTP